MRCLDCDGNTKVVDTTDYSGVVFRKRRCLVCGLKFNTMEDVVDSDDENLKEAFRIKWKN